jgi:hypothetical protein
MAHGDYNCCMICDEKMEYGGDETKERPCIYCLDRMRELGDILLTPDEMLSKLDTMPRTEALAWLHNLGYSTCLYANPIDNKLARLGLLAKDARRLKALPTKQDA